MTVIHFSYCPILQAEYPDRWLGVAALPLHVGQPEKQKLLVKVKPLCIVLHSNDKSSLELNFFLKTPFVYDCLWWGLEKESKNLNQSGFIVSLLLSMVWF